jgi:pimeloyl-ACP methyl ester carboxylesterase
VEAPEVQYAKSGAVNIAYQVTGRGPFDLVIVLGFVTHMEIEGSLPTFAPVLEQFSSFSRLIRFDKRGTGMSDRVGGAPTMETRMDARHCSVRFEPRLTGGASPDEQGDRHPACAIGGARSDPGPARV